MHLNLENARALALLPNVNVQHLKHRANHVACRHLVRLHALHRRRIRHIAAPCYQHSVAWEESALALYTCQSFMCCCRILDCMSRVRHRAVSVRLGRGPSRKNTFHCLYICKNI